jgi:hypothetical protein
LSVGNVPARTASAYAAAPLRTVAAVKTGEKPGGLGTKEPLQAAKAVLSTLPAKLQ